MAPEEDKKISSVFTAAAETLKLEVQAKVLFETLKEGFEYTNSYAWRHVAKRDDGDIVALCIDTIKNQQRQDIKLAELEARLAQLEKEATPVKLDKPAHYNAPN